MNIKVLLVLVGLVSCASAYHLCGTPAGPCERDPQVLPMPATITEDFQFEVRNMYTDRQRGARVNIFTKFRYYTPVEAPGYTTESGTFDYRDMKAYVLEAVPAGGLNISRDTFWEIVNRELAMKIWKDFPIRGLSIRMEVQGMSSGGIAGHRASTVTIGEIEPWVSSINNFPGCDGMDTDVLNKACKITPTFDFDASTPVEGQAALELASKKKAGKHDKPLKCDFCG